MMDHYYDKLLDITGYPGTNAYLQRTFAESRQITIDFVLHLAKMRWRAHGGSDDPRILDVEEHDSIELDILKSIGPTRNYSKSVPVPTHQLLPPRRRR